MFDVNMCCCLCQFLVSGMFDAKQHVLLPDDLFMSLLNKLTVMVFGTTHASHAQALLGP